MDSPLLKRRTSLNSFWGLYVVLGLLGALIWVAGFSYDQAPVSRPIIVLVGVIPLLAGILYSWLVRLNAEYRLFPESLEVESGIFARFGDVFEGYLPVRKLPGYFELNGLGTALVARRGGRRYRLGDPIEVRVTDIDRPAGKIELALP